MTMFSFLQPWEQGIGGALWNPFLYFPTTLFLAFFLIKWLFTSNTNYHQNLPPSPPKLPFIGNLHQVGALLHRSFWSLSQRYGPIILIHLGNMRTVVISSADAASEIMKTRDLEFSGRPDMCILRRLLYDLKEVSVAPYGEYWRQVKSILVLHLLSKKRVQSYSKVRDEEIALIMEKIRESSRRKKPVDLSDLLFMVANDVVCRVTFGRKFNDGGESGEKFKSLLRGFFEVLADTSFEDFIPQLAWVDRLRGLPKKVDSIAEEMDEFLEGVIEERLEIMQRRGEETATVNVDGVNGEDSFIDILLQIQKDDKTSVVSMDRDVMKALLQDSYTGTETTATLLEWVMTELMKHPRAMKRLQSEVRTVMEGKQRITEDDIEEMHYLKAVFKETLRLHPPIATLVPRVARQDVTVMGYDIPKGTLVVVNGWAIGRDPKVWNQPEEFRPERFLNSCIDFKGHHFELIPFGAGRRGCPGIAFSIATDESVIANIVREFDWALPDGQKAEDLDITERPGLTVRKKFPLLAVPSTPLLS